MAFLLVFLIMFNVWLGSGLGIGRWLLPGAGSFDPLALSLE